MSLIYIQGKVDVSSYQHACRDNNLNPDEKKCVFIFPGNSGHHVQGTTLFSIKGGAGLATASANIGGAGYPTLSLPTTSMEVWATNKEQKKIVQGALEDLYQAVGAGYHLMLPVREHFNTQYFDQALSPDYIVEPNFWGGIQKAANKPLANYYTEQLNALLAFLALRTEEQQSTAQSDLNNPFYQAYLRGQEMPEDDPWLVTKGRKGVPLVTPKIKVETNPVVDPKKNTETKQTHTTASSIPAPKKEPKVPPHLTAKDYSFYGRFYQPISEEKLKTELEKARNVLNDYTQNNSWFGRVFAGYWNRHHVNEVNQLVQQIDDGTIKTVGKLLTELERIILVNANGSLAKSIRYIREQNASSDEPQMKL